MIVLGIVFIVWFAAFWYPPILKTYFGWRLPRRGEWLQ